MVLPPIKYRSRHELHDSASNIFIIQVVSQPFLLHSLMDEMAIEKKTRPKIRPAKIRIRVCEQYPEKRPKETLIRRIEIARDGQCGEQAVEPVARRDGKHSSFKIAQAVVQQLEHDPVLRTKKIVERRSAQLAFCGQGSHRKAQV